MTWRDCPSESADQTVLCSIDNAFDKCGGLKILKGYLGVSVIKTSAVKLKHWHVEAPALVFEDQNEIIEAFNKKELFKDFIAVLQISRSKAKGMPELHRLTPILSILQNNGHKVALVTDGRMSGASGKVPAAIHLSPEASDGGILSKLKDGDPLILNAKTGELNCLNEKEVLNRAEAERPSINQEGYGRELFSNLRNLASSSDNGASILF